MSPRARILWVDADGRVLPPPEGYEPTPDAVVVVVVPGEVPDPDRTVLAALARAPDAAGVDALCRTEAVVDALVELDGAGRVVGHLDRDRHVSPALPQVVVAGWWPRLAGSIRARLESGEPLDLVALVAGLGGTVAAFGEPGSEGA